MQNQWNAFVQQLKEELSTGARGYLRLDDPFAKERELTRAIVQGLRRLFEKAYPGSASQLHHHVVFRQGDTSEDQKAWAASILDKWIHLHGVKFVPDVVIRPTLDPVTDVLPIEIKFVRKTSSASQCVALAIGQGLAYTARYPQSIVFVGLQRGLPKRKFGLADLSAGADDEARLRRSLKEQGVHLIMREVGVTPTASGPL